MIITIDGPAASGKSSVALSLSRKLGFVCINSGAAYRVITKIVIDDGLQEIDNENLVEFLQKKLETIAISWLTDDFGMKILCNGEDVTNKLFDPKIDLYVSKIAAIGMVRATVNETLNSIAKKERDVCFEGRDMGFVFYNADMKIFLTASAESRAKRRHDQIKNVSDVSYDEILKHMKQRDELDSKREISPLAVPQGAFIFDNSSYSLEETVSILEERVRLLRIV